MADRRFCARVSRMTVAEVPMRVEGPSFFHKAPLHLRTFQYAKAWLSWPLLVHSELEVSCEGNHRS